MDVGEHSGDSRHFVVALTGGIASGKSVVSREFERRGAAVHDADVIARELVVPGQPALLDIVARFGLDLLTPDGSLDRTRMRERIFHDPSERQALESILHPRVRNELMTRILRDDVCYSVLAIPLLVESGRDYDWVNRVLVVDAPQAQQIERLLHRPGITPALAQGILAAQVSRAERLERADDIIENSGTLAQLVAQVDALHAEYIRRAAQIHSRFDRNTANLCRG